MHVDATKQSPFILLVEDEEALRTAYARALRSAGYQVVAVADAETCLRMLDDLPAEQHPSGIALLVVDIRLPRMSGPAMVMAIAERRQLHAVLYISGAPVRASDRPDTLGGRRSAFLHKPFGLGDFVAMVDELARPTAR